MAKDADNLADRFDTENTGGVLSGFLAEEDEFDRRALWRLGSWAVGAIGAITIAFFANQSSIGWRRDQIAAADLARQAQQIQTVAKESQSEARRLASAIDTLNGDRDRLYSRVNVLEQGMDSVTGAIARQSAASASPQASSQGSSSQSLSQAGATPAASAPMVVAALTEVQKLPIGPPVAPVATTAPAMAAIPIPAKPVATAATVTPPADKPSTVATVTDPAPAAASPTAQAQPPAQAQTSLNQASLNQTPSNQAPSAQTPSNMPTATVPPPLMESKSMMGPPDPAAGKLIEPPSAPSSSGASSPPSASSKTTAAPLAQAPQKPEVVASAPPAAATDDGPEATESIPKVQRTEFGVDVGGANSVGGLRALWRGLLKTRANAPLAALRPIIVVKESSTGLGMQLRLVAGPLTDAAAAAKICAGMTANDRPCETTVFDGQRLSLTGNDRDQPAPTAPATTTKPATHGRHSSYRHSAAREEPAPPKPAPSTLSLIFGR
jgi:hypothetical protein